jgi:hypothetical protein
MDYWEGKMSKGKIFNTQEVQAIIAGNKRMFREICKRQPRGEMQKPYVIRDMGIGAFHYPFGKIPYQVGQKIFCKEVFSTDWLHYDDTFGEACVGDISYKATWEKDKGDFDEPEWKKATTMTEEFSRLTLQIKEIRVERLADISEEDAYKEGVQRTDEWTGCAEDLDFTDAFKFSWNATHKKPEEKFEANPWVWVVDFEVVK